jgi:hypothetical protein
MAFKPLHWLIICIIFISQSANNHPADIKHPKIKNHVIFLWDLHGVVLHQNILDIGRAIFSDKTWLIALKKMNFPLFKKFIKTGSRLIKEEGLGELFIHHAHENNNVAMANLIHNIVNKQKPIAGTVAIIHELAKNNYTHYVGSNIGQSSFKELIDSEKHPEFSQIFSHFVTDTSQIVSYQPNNDLIKKPDPIFFAQFVKNNAIDLKETTVIFIDNKLVNVKAACSIGLIGIHFKNPQQLRNDLYNLGINIARNSQKTKKKHQEKFAIA